jgi:hypothetical protein
MKGRTGLINGRLAGRVAISAVAGLIALLAVTGCAARSTPITESTASAAPATPSTTPAPTPTPTAGITWDGIGDLKIGGSFSEAATQLGTTPDPQCPAIIGTKTGWSTWVGAQWQGESVTDTINLVAIDSWGIDQPPAGTPRTDKGIGLGSSRSDVEAAYPTATAEDQPNVDFTLRYIEGPKSMVFQGRAGVVQSIQVLPAADPVSSEYCG